MAQTVIGMFDNATEAQQAVQELINSGFTQSNIDISNQNTSAATTGSTVNTDEDNDSIGGFFRSLFGDDDNDRYNRYAQVARRSGSIVTVHVQTREEAERAAEILDDNGAVDVDERAARFGYTGSNLTNTDVDTTAGTTIPIIEENLAVGKREVETGGARLRSFIVERPVEETLRLRQEHVFVNRTPVDRPATEADFTSFREGDIEVTEHGEVPVVSKEARVVEEVSLGKEVEEREETIRDTVRSTEVEVENLKKDDARYTNKDTRYTDDDDTRLNT